MILIIDCGSKKTVYIEKAVDEFMDFKTVGLFDFKSTDLESVKGVIISGAPILITEVDFSKFQKATNWIKELAIPLLGICFGHQIIGLQYGGFGSRIKEVRTWEEIESYEDCPILEMLPIEFEMMQDHCEVVSIPENFILVASSDSCVNEVMMHKEKPIFGVQFHPEVSGNHGRIIFDNFTRMCLKQ